MADSPLKQLLAFGQSPWLDFIERKLLESGELGRMIEEWGLRGMTSNPVIFNKAIGETQQYDAAVERMARNGRTAAQIYETLVVEDVRHAADLFLPVYEATEGTDGFVSLEVSPHLARDTERTIAEARRLWSAVGRRNVMIKVPGTRQGLTAIRQLLSHGININVTLLFSVARYREVIDAWLSGLEDALREGRELDRIASVASFFLSRIDTLLDRELDRLAAGGDECGLAAAALRGEVAIASARSAYGAFEEALASDRFQRLAAKGACIQRPLWASTGTKDPAYSDIKYIEALIGPHTVSTMPLQTLQAYHDHGRPELRLTGHSGEISRVFRELADVGIDLERATERLLEEGIDKFVVPYDALLQSLEKARFAALA